MSEELREQLIAAADRLAKTAEAAEKNLNEWAIYAHKSGKFLTFQETQKDVLLLQDAIDQYQKLRQEALK